MEEEDQCLSFSHLRRQPGDFCQEYYNAWSQGHTGFPFVDACMRCLIQTGWLNFRMRAMLVSFATYNLWMDWKKIAGHLARVFLDYEPGIHYPQLQMQAGTTGINAMRVYNVTKQGRDQDPNGVFIRKYVSELGNVPNEYIHEPWKMPMSIEQKCQVMIGDYVNAKTAPGRFFRAATESSGESVVPNAINCSIYPPPIVDEKSSAKTAKDKISAVRKQPDTRAEAEKVYSKHGSRRSRGENRDGARPKALSSTVKRVKMDKGQSSLLSSWKSMPAKGPTKNVIDKKPSFTHDTGKKTAVSTNSTSSIAEVSEHEEELMCGKIRQLGWSCQTCTYLNEKPFALTCSICGSVRHGSPH